MNATKHENPLSSILFNVAIPSVILIKLSDPDRLGPVYALLLSLAFPLCYSIYDLFKRRTVGLIPILGFVSILLTGGLGLLKVDGIWFAVKEAAIPLLIGLAIVISLRTKRPLLKSLLYNENFFHIDEVKKQLRRRGNEQLFERLLTKTTYLFASAFLLSAILNFVLAVVVLKSETGTVEFNQELGRMTYLSYIVIVVPCLLVSSFAIYYLCKGVKNLTGLSVDNLINRP